MKDIAAALKSYFGYDRFRQGQQETVEAILAGRDALGVMPTGAGKSVCFQLPALLLDGITIVVSPLISLMKDQVAGLRQAGIPVAYLNSTLTERQFTQALEKACAGDYKIIYMAPEQLLSPRIQDFTDRAAIALVAVDEAHCVSQWGQDFRPSYLDIARFVERLPVRPVVAAFTATATPAVRADIKALLGLQDPVEALTGFDRANLYYEVRHVSKRLDEAVRFALERPEESGIFYCATRKNVESLCAALQAAALPATRYHAGLTAEERRENQEEFSYDRKPIIVATNAFGMGIDKSNVRYVVHFNMPKDMESYYQEAGRAGRDGEPAKCVLFYNPQDMITNRFLIERDRDAECAADGETMNALREKAYQRLNHMNDYCRSEHCLRQYILRYFGETAGDHCGNCYNCNTTFEETDITRDAQKILSCVKRTGERFGTGTIVQVLRGEKKGRVVDWGLDQQSTYGLMKDYSAARLKGRVEALVQRELLVQQGGQFPTLRLGPKAAGVLFRGEQVTMRREEPAAGEKERRLPARAAGSEYAEAVEDTALFQRLKALRLSIARAQNVPAYQIFSDATLRDMCAKAPTDDAAFLEVSGVGNRKLEQYGAVFLKEIRAE